MLKGACLCGALGWTLAGQPDGATACNCTACRRYGVLWAYGYENEDIQVTGVSRPFARGKALEFHFFPSAAAWATIGSDPCLLAPAKPSTQNAQRSE